MDIAAIGIIVLRLTVPLLIVRFPMTGLLLSAAFDVIDYSIFGTHSWYQQLDKLLDLYYLTFCLYVALTRWRDPIARHLAVGLYSLRALGVGVLLAGAPEWSLVFFPNVFEMLFGFYTLYHFWSGNDRLFVRLRDCAIVVGALLLPKLLQEYSLHVAPFARSPFNTAPLPENLLGVIMWLAAPLMILRYFAAHRRIATRAPAVSLLDFDALKILGGRRSHHP